jgi:hypothetical protein
VVTHDFGFLFPELQEDPDNLLPVSPATRDALVDLGEAMAESFVDPRLVGTPDDPIDRDPNRDSDIPAAYTYFNQFVDHDTTLEASSTPGSHLTAEGGSRAAPAEPYRGGDAKRAHRSVEAG